MQVFFMALVALAMLGVLGVLLAGMIGLARGGGDPRRSNKLMQWRIILQAAALALFMLLLTVAIALPA